ncbi:MAG TPA: alpha-glucuronidase family glycosyl hydrolase [Terracidiphilus sp.]
MAAAVLVVAVSAGGAARAQTGKQAWLDRELWSHQPNVLLPFHPLSDSPLIQTATRELKKGVYHLYGIWTTSDDDFIDEIAIGTLSDVRKSFPDVYIPEKLAPQSFWIDTLHRKHGTQIIVAGGDERGALYGSFALLRYIAQHNEAPKAVIHEAPAMPIRWVDEWDNADGSIERGYAGRSIFFDAGHVREDLKPVAEYARLLASAGINGCNLNNVNNAAPFLDPEMLKGVARIADTMRPWGVRVALSVDIASPQKLGSLKSYDPLDPEVIAWWKAKTDAIYALIPDFAGFTVKADSEGQPGPASYGRTPADAANVLANALAPHNGVVLYRAFVYNHHLDWNDPKADRARAAYDIFHPLDGKFAANVIVQTKEGPIDFQAQEPVSPLFGGLENTNQAMEVQITQEYTGQQRHLVYLAPMWKGVLDFDLHAENKATPVKDILAGKSFKRPLGGMIGVAGVGQDAWLGSPLALANLYAFGRLAWDPNLSASAIADEWTRQTLGNDAQVVRTVDAMLMQSWPAYLHYTGPLGMQTLTDITGSHYGPNIEASENNGWGQWHRADHLGVGMDRSVATGTGYAGQYPPQVAKTYEDVKTTPDDLLTFFHHVPYSYKLHNGQTVIQYIYDSHYRGAEEAAELGREWATLEGKIDSDVFKKMQGRLDYQAGHAIVWRDAIVQYFLKLSGIPDEKGRAGHYPSRLEAEDAKLTGYKVVDVQPWEDASGGKAVRCDNPVMPSPEDGKPLIMPGPAPGTFQLGCRAEWIWGGEEGRYDIAVRYFDLRGGVAKFSLTADDGAHIEIGGGSWEADAQLPTMLLHGDNSTRHLITGVPLKPGDRIDLVGFPDGTDPAAVDYIEVIPTAAPQ